MANSERCCPTDAKPNQQPYAPKGTSVYIAGASNASADPSKKSRGILLVMDIFGNGPNVYRLADRLAENGFVVAMPDCFLHPGPWDLSAWPPDFESAEWKAFYQHIVNLPAFFGTCDAAIDTLKKTYNCGPIAAVGLCWGGKLAIKLQHLGRVDAIASPHPSFFDVSDIVSATGPVCILPSKEDPPMLDIKEEMLHKHAQKDKNVFERFDTLIHGFMGARFDHGTTDEAQRSEYERAVGVLIAFLNNVL